MEDTKILELILKELTEIKSVQAQHSEQLQIIKEQTARNAELESKYISLAKDVELLQVDVKLIKRAITNN